MAPKLALLISFLLQSNPTQAGGITYSRGDKDAYLTSRGDGELSSYSPSLRNLSRKSFDYDDPTPCTLYLAPSSIPNSGLGLYTSIPLPAESTISSPQVGILLQDPDFHNPSRLHTHSSTSFNLLGNYVWSASPLTYGEHETQYGEALCSGIGMMANCHYGLINVDIDSTWKTRRTIDDTAMIDGTDSHSILASKHTTLQDVGRGSFSWHSNVKYRTLKSLEAGEELFLSYGPQWYENAEGEFGMKIPSKDHYEEADEILMRFDEEFGRDDGGAYDKILRLVRDERLKAALPKRVEEVEEAIELGTARFSARDSIRTQEWLVEHGSCLDTIVGGTSTIPQAGRGAFASRSIARGDVISTTPVVTLDREHLKLFNEIRRLDGSIRRKHAGYQLLFNYCYGHPDSSLMFFPTSPSVSFINHANRDTWNAEIRWSNSSNHKADWLDMSLGEIKKLEKTGLLFDIVATKPIQRGDEILLYYGQEWEDEWSSHVANWNSSQKNFTDRLGVKTTVDFSSVEKEQVIKTVAELEEEPMPDHIMTRCGFALPGDTEATAKSGGIVKGLTSSDPMFVPCDILDADKIEGTDRYLYRAKVEHTSSSTGEVSLYSVKYDSEQDFMRYTDKPYSRDYYSEGAFRHNIGLSEGIMPEHWLDMKKNA